MPTAVTHPPQAVPVEHGEHLAERIPRAVLRIRPEEGHLGGLGAAREIFDVILGHWPEGDDGCEDLDSTRGGS